MGLHPSRKGIRKSLWIAVGDHDSDHAFRRHVITVSKYLVKHLLVAGEMIHRRHHRPRSIAPLAVRLAPALGMVAMVGAAGHGSSRRIIASHLLQGVTMLNREDFRPMGARLVHQR